MTWKEIMTEIGTLATFDDRLHTFTLGREVMVYSDSHNYERYRVSIMVAPKTFVHGTGKTGEDTIADLLVNLQDYFEQQAAQAKFEQMTLGL